MKHLILDFGNVLYNINPEITVKHLVSLSGSFHPENLLSLEQLSEDPYFILYEKGKIGNREFIEYLQKLFGIGGFGSSEIIAAWNKTLLGLFDYSFSLVKSLKNRFDTTILLSNTNELHYSEFFPECEEFFGLFDKCYFSHLLGMRKPDAEIYLYLLNSLRLSPEDCLFADDSLQNVKSACSLGINGILFTSPDRFRMSLGL